MTARATISVQSAIVGEIRGDPSQLRGEGGPTCPMLVVPLSIELEPRPQRVVVTDLWLQLYSPVATSRSLTAVAQARSNQHPAGSWCSAEGHSMSHAVDVKLTLSPLQIRALEELPVQDGQVHISATVWADVACLRDEHLDVLGPGSGIGLDLLPLPWVRVYPIQFAVPVNHWAERVMPQLGADSYRTVLVRLPHEGLLTADGPLVRWFDQARTRYDAGDWRGCIERCRDVRHGVEEALQASREKPVSDRVGAAAGLATEMTKFLDGLWQALAETTNAAHHVVGGEPLYRAADARAVLLATAVALEYLSDLLAGRSLI